MVETTQKEGLLGRFSLPVEINGRPYSFQGFIPQEPGEIRWYLKTHGQTVGYDGLIWARAAGADIQQIADIELVYIHAETPSKGSGNFLLDNFLALADFRSWRVFLFVDKMEESARNKLKRWYAEKGFLQDFTPIASLHNNVRMVRQPKAPDVTQKIGQLLSVKSSTTVPTQ